MGMQIVSPARVGKLLYLSIGLLIYLLTTPPALSTNSSDSQLRTHSYIQASLGVALYDEPILTYPGGEKTTLEGGTERPVEAIRYDRALGVNLHAAWQARSGIFLFIDYFASDGCVEDCYGNTEDQNTGTALERYYYGVGWNYAVNNSLELFSTASRERHTFNICDDRTNREEHCRNDKRRGHTLGLGAVINLGENWSISSHYERYLDIRPDTRRLQRLGNGRLTTRLEVSMDSEPRTSTYFEHVFERNQSFRLGFRFYY